MTAGGNLMFLKLKVIVWLEESDPRWTGWRSWGRIWSESSLRGLGFEDFGRPGAEQAWQDQAPLRSSLSLSITASL